MEEVIYRICVEDQKRKGAQVGGTWNLFCFDFGWSDLRLPTNTVLPTLNIRIGIVKKIVQALDSKLCVWEKKNKFNPWGSRISPAAKHRSYAVSRCGVHWQRFYAGQLSGGACFESIKRMDTFTFLFFNISAGTWEIDSNAISSSDRLGFEQSILSCLFTGKNWRNSLGLEYYLRTQKA